MLLNPLIFVLIILTNFLVHMNKYLYFYAGREEINTDWMQEFDVAEGKRLCFFKAQDMILDAFDMQLSCLIRNYEFNIQLSSLIP